MMDAVEPLFNVGPTMVNYLTHFYSFMEKNKSAWIGLLVEPQPTLYSKLVVLHADAAPDWTFYQGVISGATECDSDTGLVTFCETKTPGNGGFKTQGQLNGINSKCNPEREQQVPRPCVKSYEQILLEHGSRAFHKATRQPNSNAKSTTYNIDLLQIDTEGHDYFLIQMIDWEILRPTCINFEHTYMGRERPETNSKFNETIAKIMTGGAYQISRNKGDTLACVIENE